MGEWWRIYDLDMAGIDLIRENGTFGGEFDLPVWAGDDIKLHISKIAYSIP
ncbi:hypothetical protein RRH01S_01_00800 [Rhizobium rhizogenes NBRC 13257]|uniref:Uncharacterized protein n=1 Tax=Rhizobium rhizogenes NBRC 13257 TaxID=1220581 RepID=A0AA87PUH7_RHIRH|nr:hypothetical protein RRH01S_01_00800 [Rhizobium rhizogenes NBRC 13257]